MLPTIIFSHPPPDGPQFRSDPAPADEDEGRVVSLGCDVDGNPPPQIHWLHEDSNKVLGKPISVD